MNLGQRLKTLRKKLLLSQEAVGAQGFVSTPGWIKIENNQRLPSDQLVTKFVKWLVQDRYLPSGDQERLREELLTLKYLNHRSEFVRGLAKHHFETTDAGNAVEVSAPSGGENGSGGRGRRGAASGSGSASSAKTSAKPAARPAAKSAAKGSAASASSSSARGGSAKGAKAKAGRR